MKKHTKIYFKHFGYDTSDFVPCETCGSKAIDIHHIDARGMGGSEKDDINNFNGIVQGMPHKIWRY